MGTEAVASRAWPRPGFWLKLVVSVGLLTLVVVASEPARIVAVLAEADARWVLAAAAVWLVIQLLNVVKWGLLNRAQGFDAPFGRLWELYFIGAYFNTFLPTGFGGDAVKAYRLARESGRTGASLASVMVDRAISLYALLLLATVAVFAAPADWRVVPPGIVVGLAVAGAIAFGLGLYGTWWRDLASRPIFARWPRLGAAIAEMAEAASALRQAPVTLLLALGLAIVYQFLAVVLHHWLMLALGLSVPFGYALVFVPLLALAVNVPISINGLGVRESGFAYFLGKLGVDPAAGVSVGLLSLAMVLASAAWGAVVLSRRAKPEAEGVW